MGSRRKMAAQEVALQQTAHLLREAQLHAWKLQIVCVHMLEELAKGAPVPITAAQRERIIALEYGVEVEELPESDGLVVARIQRPPLVRLAEQAKVKLP